eukprot:GHUV01033818.1.p1 GENE.GHUV01033818.1~~GHUV01033818.1.p1  ORF type:complete len:187 (+),score=52.69 GHUV01033818.1:144-704(+)
MPNVCVPALGDLKNAATWYIVDGNVSPSEQFKGMCNVLVLASANHDNFYAFCKGLTCSPPKYMKAWDLEDLLLCHEKLYEKALTTHQLRERYAWFGGNLRSILKEANPSKVTQEAVNRYSIKELMLLVSGKYSHLGNYSHTLCHFRVDEDFQAHGISFASARVEEVVLATLQQQQQLKLQQFLEAA